MNDLRWSRPTFAETGVRFTSQPGAEFYHGDAFLVLAGLQRLGRSYPLIFLDPPYFLSRSGGRTCQSGQAVSVVKGAWDAPMTLEEMHAWNTRLLYACRELLTPTGQIWITASHHNGYSLGLALQSLGFKIQNHVTWQKPNPPPNLGCRCLTHSTEMLLWATKSAKGYTFHYDALKSANDDKQLKDVWTFPAPGRAEKTLRSHPTQKPEALLERILIAGSDPGDRILDPMCGSGTTGVAAASLGRLVDQIEADRTSLDLAIRRYQAERGIEP